MIFILLMVWFIVDADKHSSPAGMLSNGAKSMDDYVYGRFLTNTMTPFDSMHIYE